MKYILEITGEDEEALINHLATELDIFKTQKVLDFEYKFIRDKKDLKEYKKQMKKENKGFFKKIFRRKK